MWGGNEYMWRKQISNEASEECFVEIITRISLREGKEPNKRSRDFSRDL
jgi:hypothetical protein